MCVRVYVCVCVCVFVCVCVNDELEHAGVAICRLEFTAFSDGEPLIEPVVDKRRRWAQLAGMFILV